jgi:hypothetical protein
MLFDLRGRGRRRTVQAIYLSLAILMGGGLVLFGIGGATNGGLIDAIQGNGSTTTLTYTAKGKAALREAAAAWQRHLALAGDKPNTKVANEMVTAYGAGGLRNYAEAVKAQEFVIDATPKPTYQTYAQLAVLAHGAKQTRKEKLAADKAVELAGKGQAKTVRDQIKNAEQQLDALESAGQPNGQ